MKTLYECNQRPPNGTRVMKITKARREAVRVILANSNLYDADTMVICRSGVVTAIKDADKTYNGLETVRCDVGHIDDMVTADGRIDVENVR